MTHSEVYGTLGLLDGDIVGFTQMQSADYLLFPGVYNPASDPINNFSLYEPPLTTATATPFAGHDLINIDFTSLPVGTFALGYATPSLSVTATPFDEAGVSGVAAVVPEPASLALLGSALFCLGWWRGRRI
jgi:hypothetical protein